MPTERLAPELNRMAIEKEAEHTVYICESINPAMHRWNQTIGTSLESKQRPKSISDRNECGVP